MPASSASPIVGYVCRWVTRCPSINESPEEPDLCRLTVGSGTERRASLAVTCQCRRGELFGCPRLAPWCHLSQLPESFRCGGEVVGCCVVRRRWEHLDVVV